MTATPWDSRSAAQLTMMAPTTATRAPGTAVVTRLATTMTMMTAAETATVGQLTSARCERVPMRPATVPE